ATVTVTGNTSTGADGSALLVSKDVGAGTLTGSVKQNTVGNATANSGSADGNGIEVSDAGLGSMVMEVSGNTVKQYNGDGIHLQAGGPDGNGNATFTVNSNTVSSPGTTTGLTGHSGLFVQSGVGVDATTTCLALGSGTQANQVTGSGAHGGVDWTVRQRPNATVKLAGYTGGALDQVAIKNFLSAALGTTNGSVLGSSQGGGY